MPDTDDVITLDRVTKRYGARRALASLCGHVARGEFLGVLGANGAGKSTLLALLATLSRVNEGELRLFGAPAWPTRRSARARLGYLGHDTLLSHALSLEENLRFFAVMHRISAPDERVKTLMARVGLADRARDPVREFSRGMQQRAALARALLHDPELLLLDEPFSGLDQRGRADLKALLAEEHARGKTLVMVTHDRDVIVELGTRFWVLDQGAQVGDLAAGREALERLDALSARDSSAGEAR